MENNNKDEFSIGYDEAFKILMKEYFGKFARVETEYEINDLPKRVDLLIIELSEPIGERVEALKYFKRFNIIEFKSEKDRFNIKEDLYKLGIYIGGVLLKEADADIKNTTFTLVSSLRPAKLLKQYNAKLIRQGLYVVENISLLPVYVVVVEELEISYEKELAIIKDFTGKKDRNDYLKGMIERNETIENIKKIFEITLKLYSKEIREIEKREDIMTTQERHFWGLLKDLGWDKKIKEEAKELGLQQGMQQGMQQGFEIIAKNGLLQGMTIDAISKLTGLSEAQINQLKNTLKN